MARSLVLGLIAVVLLAGVASPARADMAPGFLRPKRPEPAPQQNAIDPVSGLPYPPPYVPEKKRTGVFRSCGSGMGAGLTGIGAAWAMLWLGNRLAGRVAKGSRPPWARD